MREHHLVTQVIQQGVAEGVAPAIAFSVERGGQRHRWFAGHHTPDAASPITSAATRFDLASLTKPLTTTLWALRLASAGALDLYAPLGTYVDVADAVLRETPVSRLMSHTSGLPAHRAYYEGLGARTRQTGVHGPARAAVRRMLINTVPESAPGARERYSDLGYLLLAWICEAVDQPLLTAWPGLPGHGAGALHMRPLSPQPTPRDVAGGYAATEVCPWRGGMLQGEVHDDNCWMMGGVEGHAGLFGTLDATADAARGWLRAVQGVQPLPGVSPPVLGAAVDRRQMHPLGTRVMGWDTPSPGGSTAGQHFGRRALGHLGFTGTSIWLDPDADLAMVLLTNRVCPTRENQRHRAFRPRLHDAGWAFAHAA